MKTMPSRTSAPGMRKKMTRGAMTSDKLIRLYEEDLKDIYWAEQHLLEALPTMARASFTRELRKAFEDHRAETAHHLTRLDKVFAASGLKAGAKKCEGVEGLTKEGEKVMREHDEGFVRDAGLIIVAQKIEHYEIAAYGSLRTLAAVMKLGSAAKLLQSTLDEEIGADRILTVLSATINAQAFMPQPAMAFEG